MGIGNLFKGYVFFKLLILGGVLFFVGMVITGMTLTQGEFGALAFSLPMTGIGIGVLYVSYKIWQKDSGSSTTGSAEIGYSKDTELKKCPECGKNKMKVAFDGSGICEACGHSTRDYSEDQNH